MKNFFKKFPIESSATMKLFAIIDPGQYILVLCMNVIQKNKISKKVDQYILFFYLHGCVLFFPY